MHLSHEWSILFVWNNIPVSVMLPLNPGPYCKNLWSDGVQTAYHTQSHKFILSVESLGISPQNHICFPVLPCLHPILMTSSPQKKLKNKTSLICVFVYSLEHGQTLRTCPLGRPESLPSCTPTRSSHQLRRTSFNILTTLFKSSLTWLPV